MVGFLLGLLVVAGIAWYLVFNELIIAVFCSTKFVGILIIALVQAFK